MMQNFNVRRDQKFQDHVNNLIRKTRIIHRQFGAVIGFVAVSPDDGRVERFGLPNSFAHVMDYIGYEPMNPGLDPLSRYLESLKGVLMGLNYRRPEDLVYLRGRTDEVFAAATEEHEARALE